MRRRQRGTVGFRNGSWLIYYRTPNGKQVYKRGFPTEATAITRFNEIMAEIYRGEYVDHKEIAFAEFAESYLSRRLSSRVHHVLVCFDDSPSPYSILWQDEAARHPAGGGSKLCS